MSEEEMASTPGRMSKDVAESPVRPRKITLADFISEKRTNPHVNFNLNSRTLTPHSCVTSVHGSTYDNDTHSSNTDKPTSTTSNQRDSSRTCSSGDEDEDEKEDDGKKTRPKRAVFACDGHGKRESRWKSESIRRIRLSTLIQKSRESSAKTARASELDLFNDSRSGYSLDMVSRPSTRYPPTSGESKRSRRDRVSRGDNRHTSHSHHLPDVHRQTRKRRQSLGESRGCQTSPILYHKINDNKQVTEEVKSQPITEVDDEFDYPLSQLLLEYPYNPKTKEKETKTSETGTEIALTDLQEVRRSQTIGIDIHRSNGGGKRIYDADGTIIIVTASSVINAGETVTRTDKRDNHQGIDASERSKPDTSSETKDQSNLNDKPISNNTSTPNTDSHNNNQFENTCKTQEPDKGLSCSNFAATSNAKIDSSTGTTANNALSDRVDESTDLPVPHGTLNSLEQEHISDRTTQIDKSEEMDPTGNLPGKDSENSPNIETSNETSSSINSNVAPTSEKDTSVELQLKTDNNVDQSPQDKDESVEPSTNENEINESSLESDQASSGTHSRKNNSAETSPDANFIVETLPDKNVSVETSQNKDDIVETPTKVSTDETLPGIERRPEPSEISTSDQDWQNAKLEAQTEDVKNDQRLDTSSVDDHNKQEMNQEMKSTTPNDDEKDASRRDTVLLEACKKELSEEVQLGQAVLNVIQMWKDSAVVRSIKNHEKKNGRASSSAFEDERENWKSSSNGQRSRKSSERGNTHVLQKDSTSNVLKATTAAKSQQKEIQIVIRNPGRNGVSNKESAVKIVIKLPNGSNQPSPVNIPDATEAKVTQPSNETEEPDHQTNVQSPDVPEQEPEEVPNQEPEKPPDQEPSPDVVEIPVKEISETQVILPPITEPLASEPNREFKRLIHVNSGKRRAPSLISIRKATVTTASLRMREVDGVYCSNNGVYIGHDRKLYNTFKDASQTSRVDQILENFKGMRNGNIGKPEFLYDQANDEVFQTHLDTFRRGNSRKSRINGSVVLAASKLYSQARTRKAKAYSNLHKKLTSAVNY